MTSTHAPHPAGDAAATPGAPDTPPRAQRGVRIGLVLFGIGVIALLVDVLPFFFGQTDRPLWLNLACLLVPVGLIWAVWAALARGRREQKAALREVERLRRG